MTNDSKSWGKWEEKLCGTEEPSPNVPNATTEAATRVKPLSEFVTHVSFLPSVADGPPPG